MIVYIFKGVSEIHWEGKKLTHFELIRNLLKSAFGGSVKEIINQVIEKFDASKVKKIIECVDQEVPDTHDQYRIPESRKRLIYKIIALRFKKLETLVNE